MSETRRIAPLPDAATLTIHAAVRDGERGAVDRATALLTANLSAAAGSPWSARATYYESPSEIPRAAPGVTILSLAIDLTAAMESRETRRVWERLLTDRRGRETGPSFLCTIFRHVHDDADPAVSIERIRRLNLLAAELSQATGVSVIDLDRALAHVGGRTLGADYRLGSAAAHDAAGHAIATTLLAAGLDPLVPFEISDAAKAALGPWRPHVSSERAAGIADAARVFTARRDGTRLQVFHASGATPMVRSNVDDLLSALRERRIGLGEAASVVARGIRRLGPRRVLAMAWREASRRLIPRRPSR